MRIGEDGLAFLIREEVAIIIVWEKKSTDIRSFGQRKRLDWWAACSRARMSWLVCGIVPYGEVTEIVRRLRRVLEMLADCVERPVSCLQRLLSTQTKPCTQPSKAVEKHRGGLESQGPSKLNPSFGDIRC